MSQSKKKVKKVVATKTKKVVGTSSKKIKPTSSKTRSRASKKEPVALTFQRINFIWMGVGALLVVLGMLLMMGGAMPSPDVWDDSIIYSFRRTVLAPIVILAGLVVEIYAIFKKA